MSTNSSIRLSFDEIHEIASDFAVYIGDLDTGDFGIRTYDIGEFLHAIFEANAKKFQTETIDIV